MPVGPLCRSCGAALPPDIRWCTTCYTPVPLYSRRERLHGPGRLRRRSDAHAQDLPVAGRTDVIRPARPDRLHPRAGSALPVVGTQRVQPAVPWAPMGWVLAAVVVLRSTWKPERLTDPTPTTIERFRARHPVLGKALRLSDRGRAGHRARRRRRGRPSRGSRSTTRRRYVWAVVVDRRGGRFFLATGARPVGRSYSDGGGPPGDSSGGPSGGCRRSPPGFLRAAVRARAARTAPWSTESVPCGWRSLSVSRMKVSRAAS